jgi:thymidylate synthase
MINFQPVDVCGKTIDQVWFQLLKQVLIYGRPYKKDEGSFAGEDMLELDRVSGTIFEPLQYNVSGIRKPLAVTVPGGVDAPTTDEYIERYFVEYLMDSNLPPTEHYRYSTFITGGRYTLPKLDFLIPDRPSWYSADEVMVKVPNQIQWCIDHYKTKGFHNNHCLMQLGYPESNLAYDKPFEDETERGTSPCLRLIDTKIVKDPDGEFYLCFYVTFRSWNLWGGWPTNIGGLALLMEYMAHELEVNPGPLSFNSKAMNIYKFQLTSLMNRVGTVE